MARRAIEFDGVSLQDTTYQTQDFMHESMDNRQANFQRLGDRDGEKLVDDHFGPKKITLTGIVKGTDIDDLETNLDTLNELIGRKERNLDVQYAGDTRRYIATCTSKPVIRRHFNITFVPFTIQFKVSNPPFGMPTDTSTAAFDGVSFTGTGTYEGNYTFVGSAPPMPNIEMTANAAAHMSKVTFTNTSSGGEIIVERAFTAGEVLIINTSDYTVTVDGVAIDFDGIFPEFVAGGNEFKFAVRANTANLDFKFIYYPFYH